MKVGILTYHKAHNYGAMLQAVALRTTIEQLGHKAYFIDYWPEYHRKRYELRRPSLLHIIHSPRSIIKYIQSKPNKLRRIDSFLQFQAIYIDPYCKSIEEEYDIIMYGSDQIWRKQPIIKKYNPMYFGVNNIKAQKHISYAASMGNMPKEEDYELLHKLLSHLDYISVREDDLFQVLNKIGITNSVIVLDPTLLLNSSQWNITVPTRTYNQSKYVLVYSMMKDSINIMAIKQFAASKGLNVRIIDGYAKAGEHNIDTTIGPSMFVELIKNAEYVFTSSFHGLAFSVIYQKEVYVSFASNSRRAEFLLDSLGICNHILKPMQSRIVLSSPIDYEAVNKKLFDLQLVSKEFLSSSIQ